MKSNSSDSHDNNTASSSKNRTNRALYTEVQESTYCVVQYSHYRDTYCSLLEKCPPFFDVENILPTQKALGNILEIGSTITKRAARVKATLI
jgi:hypothetical protein